MALRGVDTAEGGGGRSPLCLQGEGGGGREAGRPADCACCPTRPQGWLLLLGCSTQSARAVGELGSGVGRRVGREAARCLSSKESPDCSRIISPGKVPSFTIWQDPGCCLKAGDPPPGVGRTFSLCRTDNLFVRPFVRPFYFSASLCPPLPPQRGKIKCDSSILSAASCLSSFSSIPGWNNGARSSERRGRANS